MYLYIFLYSNLSVVIVVDLSKPEEIWTTLEVFLKQVCTDKAPILVLILFTRYTALN